MEAFSGFIFAAIGAAVAGLGLRYHTRRTARLQIEQIIAEKRRRRSEAVARGNRTRAAKRAEAVRAKAAELTSMEAAAGSPDAMPMSPIAGERAAQA